MEEQYARESRRAQAAHAELLTRYNKDLQNTRLQLHKEHAVTQAQLDETREVAQEAARQSTADVAELQARMRDEQRAHRATLRDYQSAAAAERDALLQVRIAGGPPRGLAAIAASRGRSVAAAAWRATPPLLCGTRRPHLSLRSSRCPFRRLPPPQRLSDQSLQAERVGRQELQRKQRERQERKELQQHKLPRTNTPARSYSPQIGAYSNSLLEALPKPLVTTPQWSSAVQPGSGLPAVAPLSVSASYLAAPPPPPEDARAGRQGRPPQAFSPTHSVTPSVGPGAWPDSDEEDYGAVSSRTPVRTPARNAEPTGSALAGTGNTAELVGSALEMRRRQRMAAMRRMKARRKIKLSSERP